MVQVTRAGHTGDVPADHSDDETSNLTSQPAATPSLTRDASLASLRRRAASGSESNPEGARRRRTPLARQGDGSAAEGRPERARTGDAQARNAEDTGWMRHLWKAYVGALAVGAGYSVYHGTREAALRREWTPSSPDSWQQPPTPRFEPERIDLPAVYQARADVLARFGAHIPSDSDCHAIEPSVGTDLPPKFLGLTNLRHSGLLTDPKVRDLTVRETLPRDIGAHVARHEYVHCYASPQFQSLLLRSGQVSFDEGLAQHFTDQFPGVERYRGTRLDNRAATAPAANGKSGLQLAAELERTVGKDTLERAYFGGEPDAIAIVADAAYAIWPKAPTTGAWLHTSRWRNDEQQVMAECFVGAALLHTGALPREALGDIYPVGFALPVARFADISAEQATRLRSQAAQARNALGHHAFDRAFCATNPVKQEKAMNKLADELFRQWTPVLA